MAPAKRNNNSPHRPKQPNAAAKQSTPPHYRKAKHRPHQESDSDYSRPPSHVTRVLAQPGVRPSESASETDSANETAGSTSIALAAAAAMSPASRLAHNLKVVKRRDPSIVSIFDQFSHVCVYHYDEELQKWSKNGFEGTMFLYERDAYPPYGFYILNRMGADDYVQRIYPEDLMRPASDYFMTGQFPDYTARRIAAARLTPKRPGEDDRFGERWRLAEDGAEKGRPQVRSLWMVANQEKEDMHSRMMQLHAYIKQNSPYPMQLRNLPPPAPSSSATRHTHAYTYSSTTDTDADADTSDSSPVIPRPKAYAVTSTSTSQTSSVQTVVPQAQTGPNAIDALFARFAAPPLAPAPAESPAPGPAADSQARGQALLQSIFASASPTTPVVTVNGAGERDKMDAFTFPPKGGRVLTPSVMASLMGMPDSASTSASSPSASDEEGSESESEPVPVEATPRPPAHALPGREKGKGREGKEAHVHVHAHGTEKNALAHGVEKSGKGRTLVPFAPDSELWPYVRPGADDADAVVELDFSDTRALADLSGGGKAKTKIKGKGKEHPNPAAANLSVHVEVNGVDEGSRRKKKKKTREERQAALEQSWDTPVPLRAVGLPALSTGPPSAVVNGAAGAEGAALVDAFLAGGAEPRRVEGKKELVREILTRIHTDPGFVDALWDTYVLRVAGS